MTTTSKMKSVLPVTVGNSSSEVRIDIITRIIIENRVDHIHLLIQIIERDAVVCIVAAAHVPDIDQQSAHFLSSVVDQHSISIVMNSVVCALEPEQRVLVLVPGRDYDPGATHMMVSHISNLDHAVSLLGSRTSDSADTEIAALLKTPYPFARYLALREVSQNPSRSHEELLLSQLDRSAKAVDPVGFYWTCEALARGRIVAAIPTLARYATAGPVKNLHGPIGMGYGYPAAKALGRIAGRIEHAEVQRLLGQENIWLVAGVLAGLTEAGAPGIRGLLGRFSDLRHPAIIRNEAAVGLRRLKEK